MTRTLRQLLEPVFRSYKQCVLKLDLLPEKGFVLYSSGMLKHGCLQRVDNVRAGQDVTRGKIDRIAYTSCIAPNMIIHGTLSKEQGAL